MNKTTKYYIEFSDDNLDITNDYVMQSKWFSTEGEAREWFDKLNRDLDFNSLRVRLMYSEFDEYDGYPIDIMCKEILY